MNFLPLVIVSAVLHGFIAWRVVPELGAALWQTVLVTVLVVSALLMPVGLLGSRLSKQPWADRLSWIGLLLMGLFSSLFVLTALRDVSLLVLTLTNMVLPGRLPLVQITQLSAVAVPVLALAVTVVGFFNARRTPAVVRVDIPIKGLPGALQGFTLVQISDVHVGPTIKQAYLQRIVHQVNTLGADVVAITGDLVDGSVAMLAAHVAPLAQLQSRHGTFFVTGNHEYYSGVHAWMAELRRLGLTVLMNEHVVGTRSQYRHKIFPLIIGEQNNFRRLYDYGCIVYRVTGIAVGYSSHY